MRRGIVRQGGSLSRLLLLYDEIGKDDGGDGLDDGGDPQGEAHVVTAAGGEFRHSAFSEIESLLCLPDGRGGLDGNVEYDGVAIGDTSVDASATVLGSVARCIDERVVVL